MTTAVLTHSYLYKKVKKQVASVALPKVNWKMICAAGFLACLLSLFFYIYQVISLTKTSYLIGSYNNKILTVSEENKNLEVSFAENSFLGEVLAKSQQLDFQKTTSVKYIKISDNSVAMVK
jgi:hypothetical protein